MGIRSLRQGLATLVLLLLTACGFPFGISCGDCEVDEDCGDEEQCTDGDCSDLPGKRIVCNDCLLDTDSAGGYDRARLRVQIYDPERDEALTDPVIWLRSDAFILDGVPCTFAIEDLPGVEERVIWGDGELVDMELDLSGTCVTTATSATGFGGSFIEVISKDDDRRAAVPLVVDND
jgi:hypothetical protein